VLTLLSSLLVANAIVHHSCCFIAALTATSKTVCNVHWHSFELHHADRPDKLVACIARDRADCLLCDTAYNADLCICAQSLQCQERECDAGAALVNAHGKSQFQPMLQLFEGYLDKKDVADEARYDKVREGAIVFLGTLARHLDPSDSKVN